MASQQGCVSANNIGQVQIAIYNSNNPKRECLKNIIFNLKDSVPTFTGRTDELFRIRKHLTSSKSLVVCGLGGMGKTELCRHYAWKHKDLYKENVIWFNAEDKQILEDSLRQLAIELDVHVRKNNLSRNVSSVLRDIYSKFKEQSCLIVFDNAISLRDIRDYLPTKIEKNFPIYILIISQNTEWASYTTLHLHELQNSDAVDLVNKCLTEATAINADKINVFELVTLMQCMPLALQQAAAYINDTNMYKGVPFNIRDYINKFQTEPCLLDFQFPDYEINDYSKTVSKNISLIWRKLEKLNVPLALDILKLVAYFDAEDIEISMFKPLLDDVKLDLLHDSFRVLKKYSLVTFGNNLQKYSYINIHRLVQVILRQIVNKLHSERDVLIKGLDLTIWKYFQSTHFKNIIFFAAKSELLEYYYYICSQKYSFWINIFSIQAQFAPITTKPDNKTESHVGLTQLTLAARNGDLDLVKRLVNEGANVNETDIFFLSPLSYALLFEHVEVAKYLIEAGTNVNGYKTDYLHLATAKNLFELVEILTNKGADFKSESRLRCFFKCLAPTYGSYTQPVGTGINTNYVHLLLCKLIRIFGTRKYVQEEYDEQLLRYFSDSLLRKDSIDNSECNIYSIDRTITLFNHEESIINDFLTVLLEINLPLNLLYSYRIHKICSILLADEKENQHCKKFHEK